MADGTKQVRYGDLESDFFGRSIELSELAKKSVPKNPEKGQSAGNTFIQAHFGHKAGVKAFCDSMEDLCHHTRKLLNDAGTSFKEIDDCIARNLERGAENVD